MSWIAVGLPCLWSYVSPRQGMPTPDLWMYADESIFMIMIPYYGAWRCASCSVARRVSILIISYFSMPHGLDVWSRGGIPQRGK